MDYKKAQILRDTLMLIGFVIMFAGYFWNPLAIIGFVIALSCLVPDYLYNKCPHCGKRLGRNAGKFCQHCGKEID
ncbi:MAG: zinc ribbon domain-containing protein [Oscillospiraceae bacterium]|nr:zinc ribbon domain-containing protein [Oscillospiraceae bacterium]